MIQPATSICDNGSKIAVLQNHTGYLLNIIDSYLEWERVRLLWIAFYKNRNENKNGCYFGELPKDLIKHIIKFVCIQPNDTSKLNCVRLMS